MNLDARAIAAATGGIVLRDGAAGPVLTDTRADLAGAWFLALRGERFDAHDFLEQAAAKGAIGVIVERPPAIWDRGLITVKDAVTALQQLALAARRRFKGPVVAITGSSGKTTTRALTTLALRGLGPVHQTQGNLNNHLGVPMTLLAVPDEAAAMVVEMGTSAPGEIATLCAIAEPDGRLIVNVGPAHLQELGGLDGVAREKGALFATARPGDLLAVNVDDERVRDAQRPSNVRAVRFGIGSDADVRLVSARVDPTDLSTHADYQTPMGPLHVRFGVPGVQVAFDAAGALALAYGLGADLSVAAAALGEYAPVGMRLRKEPLPKGAIAINDAYNANPSSMEAALRTLASLPGRRAAVLGDMLELGADEDVFHADLVRLAASLGLDLIVLVGPRMKRAEAAVVGTPVWAAEDGLELVPAVLEWLSPGAFVLFKGSRGARVERILQSVQGGTGSPADGGH